MWKLLIYDNLGQEQAQQTINRLLGGIHDVSDLIPDYPEAQEPAADENPGAGPVLPVTQAPAEAAPATSGLSQNALIIASG